ENLRDIVVDEYGNIDAFNGTFVPFLTRYSPISNSFSHRPFPTWKTPNTTSYGAIAAYQNFIFVNDLPIYAEPSAGIIRVDSLTNDWIRFANGQQYID